jgi:membrane-associated phospholipid phosphatase
MPTWSSLPAIAPPPAWESDAFIASRTAFVGVQRDLNAARRASARHWEYPAGSVTPVGAWIALALDLVARADLAPLATAALFARLGSALHDGMVACWRAKYRYRVARPVQWLPAHDPTWWPLLDTPPHPSYPSGHAVASGVAAAVLGSAFPTLADWLAQRAQQAADSRVFGGIHWPIDSNSGLQLGRAIGDLSNDASYVL